MSETVATTGKPPEKPWKCRHDYWTGKSVWDGLTEETLAEYRKAVDEYNQQIQALNSERKSQIEAAAELLAAHGFPREYRRDTGRTRKRYETVTLFSVLSPFIPVREQYRPYLD